MDLFGPTFVKSVNKKIYCLVVTDDYSRFTWVFFLAIKDETSPMLKTFITGLENQLSLKVKVIRSNNGTEFKNNDLNQFWGMKGIKREFSVLEPLSKMELLKEKTGPLLRLLELCWQIHFYPFHFGLTQCDNGTEFKNADLNQFCGLKGIKWEFSVPRTPQQNGIAKRKNRTLIEAARTLLADSLLPIPLWAFQWFEDPEHPDKVYKVVKELYGLHQAPRAWYETLATYLLENRFQTGKIDQTLIIKKQQQDILLVKQKKDGIFISQDKYVAEILRKFRLSDGKSASTPIDAEKPLLKDSDAYSDSDYAGASLDKKYTTGGCQFLGYRLISWQCKKQTVVATSSIEAEYVAAASGCA
nr:putative ribonuclease H-like domain-containing protein [Tanacetum cinerariifolium]